MSKSVSTTPSQASLLLLLLLLLLGSGSMTQPTEQAPQGRLERAKGAFRDLNSANVIFFKTTCGTLGHLSSPLTPDDEFKEHLSRLVGAYETLFDRARQAISLNLRLALDIRYGRISPEQRASYRVLLPLASHCTVSVPPDVPSKKSKQRQTIIRQRRAIIRQLLKMAPKRDAPFERWNGFIEVALSTTGTAPVGPSPMAQSICEQYGDLLAAAFELDVIAAHLEALISPSFKRCAKEHRDIVLPGLEELQRLFGAFEAVKDAYFQALGQYENSLGTEQIPSADFFPSISFQCGFCPLRCIKAVSALYERLYNSLGQKEMRIFKSPTPQAQQPDGYADLSSQLQSIFLRRFIVPTEVIGGPLSDLLKALNESKDRRLEERTLFLSEVLTAPPPSDAIQRSLMREQLKTFRRRLHQEAPLYYAGYLGSEYNTTQALNQLIRIVNKYPRHFEPELRVLQPKRAACSTTPNAAILVAKTCLLWIASASASLEALLCELKLDKDGGDGRGDEAMEMRLERRRSDGSPDRSLNSLLVELRDATIHFLEASHYYGSHQDVLLAVDYLETAIRSIIAAVQTSQRHSPGDHPAADSLRAEAATIQHLVGELQVLYEQRVFIDPERRASYWLLPPRTR